VSIAHALRDARPGDLVDLGRYPQQADGADSTPVSWLVLERRGEEVLLVSARVLDCRRWHDELTETTWRDSSMRRWLDGTFLPRAFTGAEQELLVPHRCDDDDGTPGTVDRVFLLGVREARALTHSGRGDGVDRRAVATPFAAQQKSDGSRLYV
jgi:hypothetical protein